MYFTGTARSGFSLSNDKSKAEILDTSSNAKIKAALLEKVSGYKIKVQSVKTTKKNPVLKAYDT